MKIKKIKAKNFLTFDEKFEFEPDKELSIIVGPNGAGKTNVFRLLEFIGNYFHKGSNINDYIQDMNNEFSVEVTISLSDDEMKIINDYFVFSLINEDLNSNKSKVRAVPDESDVIRAGLYKILADGGFKFKKPQKEGHNNNNFQQTKDNDKLQQEDVNDFTIRIRKSKYKDSPIELDFIFKINENTYYKGYQDGIRIQDQNFRKYGKGLIELIKDYLKNKINTPDIYLEDILNNTEFKNNSYKIDIGGSVDLNIINYNYFDDLLNSGYIDNNDKNKLLDRLDKFINKIKSVGYLDKNIYLDDFLMTLYNKSIIILKNPRAPPEGFILKNNKMQNLENNNPNSKQNVSPIPLIETINGNDAIEKLFYLYNSQNSENRKLWEMFIEKVKETVEMEPYLYIETENILNNGDKPITKIAFELKKQTKEGSEEIYRTIPLEFAPAGAIEVLSIFASIAISGGKVLLLDEPAQNLHPPLQKRLYKHLEDFIHETKSQVIMITHSPYMINPLKLQNVWRIWKNNDDISQIKCLKNISKYKKWWVRQSKLVASLFSDVVVLAEGEDEEAALEVWFENNKVYNEKEIQILSVGGQGNFKTHVEILTELNIKFFVFCDKKAYEYLKENSPEILKELESTERIVYCDEDDFSIYLKNNCNEKYLEAIKDYNYSDEKPTKDPTIMLIVADKCKNSPPDKIKNLINKVKGS